MSKPKILMRSELPLPPFCHGKVRDTYDLGELLLIVATDRISAFDFVLPCGIPGKGAVLNQLSAFWFERTKHVIPNHLVESLDNAGQLEKYLPNGRHAKYPAELGGRAMVVRKLKRLPVECVARGYIAGSAWEEYRRSGTACGIPLPPGLRQSQELPEVLFTPTTKADSGHDMPLTREELNGLIGPELAEKAARATLAVYNYAREYARPRGIIIADTKMEFGLDGERLVLIDELLTPDSSRFWDARLYEPGRSQPSYDKQPVRDWLVESGWNKEPPIPALPPEVIEATSRRYREAFRVLTGADIKLPSA